MEYKSRTSCGKTFRVIFPIIIFSHDAPLISVICPEDFKTFLISGDSKGSLKLWNLQNFTLVQNVLIGEGVGRMKAMIYRPSDNKLIVSSKKLYRFFV